MSLPRDHAPASLERGPAQFQRYADVARPESPQLGERHHHHWFNPSHLVTAAPVAEGTRARFSLH